MEGLALIKEIARGTGLPEDWVQQRLRGLMAASGLDPETAGLEQLREVLATLVQDVLIEAKASIRSQETGS